MYDMKSYTVEFLQQEPEGDKTKFMQLVQKRMDNLKVKYQKLVDKRKANPEVEVSESDNLSCKKIIAEIRTLKNELQSAQKVRKAVIIRHKKSGLSVLSRSGLESAMDEFKKRLRTTREIRKERRIDTKHITPPTRDRHDQDSMFLNRIGGAFEVPETFLNLYNIKKIETPKEPRTDENHVGIEIEFASFLKKTDVSKLLIDNNLEKYCQLHHEYMEGRHPKEFEYEISAVIPQSRAEEVIKKLCDVLNEKMDANITYGCGLHVHIDCRNRDIEKVYHNMFMCQDLLYSMVNPARRNNRFAQKAKTAQWYPIKNDWKCNKCGYFGDECSCESRAHIPKDGQVRYLGLNTWSYLKHKTFEVRIHAGSSNASKIINWMNFLNAISDAGELRNKITTPLELEKAITMNEELYKYVNEKVKQFT